MEEMMFEASELALVAFVGVLLTLTLAMALAAMRAIRRHDGAARAAILASEERFDIIARATNDAIWDWNLKTHHVWWNDGVRTLFGYGVQDVGLTAYWWKDRVHPEDRTRVVRGIENTIHGSANMWRDEYRFQRADGSYARILDRGYILRDSYGRAVRLVAAMQDQSERKDFEDALRASEERFRSTFENAAVGIAHVATNGRWLRVNDKFCAITGFGREELLAKSFQDITHPDDVEADIITRHRMIAGELKTHSMEKRYVSKTGEPIWVNLTISLVDTSDGAPDYFITIVEDISLRKRAQMALRESEERLALALEAGQLGFWDWDVPSGYVRFGGQWSAMLGYAPGEIEPNLQGWQRLTHPEDKPAIEHELQEHLLGHTPYYACEYRMRHKSGHWIWVLGRGRVVERSPDGGALRAVGTHSDISLTKQTESRLREALAARDIFLATASHELKTPLTPLALRLSQLKRSAAGTQPGHHPRDREVQTLEVAETQVRRLAVLVDGLLDVSRIAEGRLVLALEPVDVTDAARETVLTMAPYAERVGSLLVFDGDSAAIAALDRVRLGQILTNIVSNALKFGAGKPVHVNVTKDDAFVRLSVKDQGIGIPHDKLDRIFDRFERAVSERHYGGLGLGLYVSQQLAEAMGGTIQVRSELGAGATFIVEFPLLTVPAAPRVLEVAASRKRDVERLS